MKDLPTDKHLTYAQQVRKCGKPYCGTCNKSGGHGPYWYAYYRQDGKVRCAYIGKTMTTEQIAAWKARRGNKS